MLFIIHLLGAPLLLGVGPHLSVVMEADIRSLRRKAAVAGRAVMANALSYDEFMGRFADNGDDLVSDLVYLLEHEPQRGGFLGVNERDWAQYQSQLTETIRPAGNVAAQQIVGRERRERVSKLDSSSDA